jgi:hypothetical protein
LGVHADPADDGEVERGVGLPVAAAVEAMTLDPGGGRQRGDAAEHGEACLCAQPLVVTGGDQQLPGNHDADAGPREQPRGKAGDLMSSGMLR